MTRNWLAFAEIEFGDDRAPRLEPRQPQAGPAIGFWLSAHEKSVAVPAMAIWNTSDWTRSCIPFFDE